MSKRPAAKKPKAGLGRALSSKTAPPLAKTGSVMEVGVPKTARPKAKPRLRGTLEIELACEACWGV
jgi:hypothetical protein